MKQPEKFISIVTCNMAGMLLSPYQYYQTGNDVIKNISQEFKMVRDYEFQIRENEVQITQDFKKFLKNINRIKLYEQDKEKKLISTLVDNFKKKDFNMGTINLIWAKDRYAPAISKYSGLYQKKQQKYFLINQSQFLEKWNQILKNNYQKSQDLKKYIYKKNQQTVVLQLYMCMIFDLCCYKALVNYFCITQLKKKYQNDKLKNLQDIFILSEQDQIQAAKYYQQGQQKQFKQPFLNQNDKIAKTIQWMYQQKNDIYLFQQVNINFIKLMQGNSNNVLQMYCINSNLQQKVWDLRKNYELFTQKNSNSIIFISRKFHLQYKINSSQFLKKYSEVRKKSPGQLQNQLNFNSDSIFVVCGNYLILNVHLTSNQCSNHFQHKNLPFKEKCHVEQLERIFQHINNINDTFKDNPLNIIVGGDFNFNIFAKHQMKNKIKQLFNFQLQNVKSTVLKQRTQTQPQTKKADVLDKAAKDFILGKNFQDNKVLMINQYNKESQVNNEGCFIPCKTHPFDHFIVKATILKAQKANNKPSSQKNNSSLNIVNKNTQTNLYLNSGTGSLMTKQQYQALRRN